MSFTDRVIYYNREQSIIYLQDLGPTSTLFLNMFILYYFNIFLSTSIRFFYFAEVGFEPTLQAFAPRVMSPPRNHSSTLQYLLRIGLEPIIFAFVAQCFNPIKRPKYMFDMLFYIYKIFTELHKIF